jgi:uracil-DNA glycosylase family 4
MFKPKTQRPYQACGLCGLYLHCQSPKIPVTGKGHKGILLVNEYPDWQDDIHNEHLTGESGDLLRKYMQENGINVDKDCWSTAAIICYTKTPDEEQLPHCHANLLQTIEELKPSTIILMGSFAMLSLAKYMWNGKEKAYRDWIGSRIPIHTINAWVCTIFSPREILLNPKNIALKTLLKQQIKSIAELKGKPWTTFPDFKKRIDVEVSSTKAALKILEFLKEPGPIAFDYECNRLKPDTDNAKIYSCSISNGKRTIAFPWTNETAAGVSKILLSDKPKYAHNLKFEDRWTRAILKHPVYNWRWDSMLAAHVINSATNVSLKFQSFLHFGQTSYDEHIKPYLEACDENGLNRIKDVPIHELLLYNGMDSLFTFKLARKQMRILGQ